MNFYDLSAAAQEQAMRQLAEHALAFWGHRYEVLSLLKYRENAVFSVRAACGRKAVLRIHRHAYHSDAELMSELQWMEALKDRGLPVPGLVPTDAGERFVTVVCDAVPEPRQVDMLEWLDGEPLGQLEAGLGGNSSEIYRHIGRLAGRLHNEASVWTRPAGFVRHAWDAEGLLGAAPLWGRFWELSALSAEQAALIATVRAKARADLDAFGQSPETYGLIHADFVPENLMRKGDELMLIDFDDAGFGWHMFELATALFFHLGEAHYEAMKAGVFEGYRAVRPLAAEQERKLPLFLLLRGLTYLGWVHTRSETETARELTPMLIERACEVAEQYLRTSV